MVAWHFLDIFSENCGVKISDRLRITPIGFET